ncbi:MAG TPA: hypothetical protein VFC85_03215 [Verrucomicrobiae bacterium]|nr:hypothetical protein [Verrucomicrobiae bacterium]
MSQNIFIDVDGTLLNSNEGVDPRAQEILRQIRLKLNAEYPDSGLYLWSGAGGDYARSKAQEHGLSGFFSGFAGKPDIIIDDNPPSVLPRRTIMWRDDSQWQNLKSSIFAEFSPTPKLIEHINKTIEIVGENDNDFEAANFYVENQLRCPIPFFGDLAKASYLTVSVNPSSQEFRPSRNWTEPDVTNATRLAFRLVNYFRNPKVAPHPWFGEFEEALRVGGHSFQTDTAHVDLSPRATRWMTGFNDCGQNAKRFLKMLKDDLPIFAESINLCEGLEEIWFVGVLITETEGWRMSVGDFAQNIYLKNSGSRLNTKLKFFLLGND